MISCDDFLGSTWDRQYQQRLCFPKHHQRLTAHLKTLISTPLPSLPSTHSHPTLQCPVDWALPPIATQHRWPWPLHPQEMTLYCHPSFHNLIPDWEHGISLRNWCQRYTGLGVKADLVISTGIKLQQNKKLSWCQTWTQKRNPALDQDLKPQYETPPLCT